MSPVGWHCLVAPAVQPVPSCRKMFADGLPLPGRMADISNFHLHLHNLVTTPSTNLRGEATVLLTGARVGHFTFADISNNRRLPPFAGGEDFITAAIERVGAIIMADEFAEARERYIDLLSIDPAADTAELLAELHRVVPAAADALLARQFEYAADVIRQSNQPIDLQMVRDTIASMRRVDIAYWLRTSAMECAARLRRPYSFPPLDTADRPDRVRYGQVHERMTDELAIAENILDRFTTSARPSRSIFRMQLNASTNAVPMTSWGCWFVDPALERSGRALLECWRHADGSELEQGLISEVRHARSQLAVLKHRLGQVARSGGSENSRVGNMTSVEPLLLLYHQTRFAVACSTDVAIAAWARRVIEGEAADLYSVPRPQKRQGGTIKDVYTLLRRAIVQDDEMLPMALRDQAATQEIARRTRDRPFSLDEIEAATSDAIDSRSGIFRKAKVRINASWETLEDDLRVAIGPSLAKLWT